MDNMMRLGQHVTISFKGNEMMCMVIYISPPNEFDDRLYKVRDVVTKQHYRIRKQQVKQVIE